MHTIAGGARAPSESEVHLHTEDRVEGAGDALHVHTTDVEGARSSRDGHFHTTDVEGARSFQQELFSVEVGSGGCPGSGSS